MTRTTFAARMAPVAAAAIALTLVAAPAPLFAQAANDSGGAAQAMVPPEAEAFATKAAVSGLYEIEAGRIAAEKAKDPDVRAFGQQMVTDHSKADQELRQAAGVLQLPMATDAAHEALLKALRDAGDDFDKIYVQQQIDAHREAVELFTQFSTTGPNGTFRAFAAKTLPVLQMHQEMAGRLAEKVK
ncbi:MAG: DUF4142 domain-containing protein [Bosea sp.]|nr:DUF4142 domain-containing protein [Bosea sp. (in: a-proteobacteria)]